MNKDIMETEETDEMVEHEEAIRGLGIPERIHATLLALQDFNDDNLPLCDLISIAFILRLIDSLHRCFYATFLSLSYADELRKKLHVENLDLEVEVYATRWSWRDGKVSIVHRISWDFDLDVIQSLTKLAGSVLDDEITAEEGLVKIYELEKEGVKAKITWIGKFEHLYKTLPGRMLVIPLLSLSGSIAYFNGTYVDAGFSVLTGLVAGYIHYVASLRPNVSAMEDILVSIVTGMLAAMAITFLPDSTCFNALVLGTLYWFLYGIAFMISLYEIYNRQLVTGVTRLALALINTYGLAFGISIGLWLAWYAGGDRYDVAGRSCDNLDYKVPDTVKVVFFVLTLFPALMQFRVGVHQWPICLAVQAVGVASQYLIGNLWGQPSFIANVIPTYAVTLTAHAILTLSRTFGWSHLGIPADAFRRKVFHKKEPKMKMAPQPDEDPREQDNRDSSFGWADRHQHRTGYMRQDKRYCKSTDLWSCILPAIYLLVPGSSAYSNAFAQIWASGEVGSAGEHVSSVFVIGLGQAIGVRLALATLGLGTEAYFHLFVEKVKSYSSHS